jgi:hypothetical protein
MGLALTLASTWSWVRVVGCSLPMGRKTSDIDRSSYGFDINGAQGRCSRIGRSSALRGEDETDIKQPDPRFSSSSIVFEYSLFASGFPFRTSWFTGYFMSMGWFGGDFGLRSLRG